jgi:hypothetical protein
MRLALCLIAVGHRTTRTRHRSCRSTTTSWEQLGRSRKAHILLHSDNRLRRRFWAIQILVVRIRDAFGRKHIVYIKCECYKIGRIRFVANGPVAALGLLLQTSDISMKEGMRQDAWNANTRHYASQVAQQTSPMEQALRPAVKIDCADDSAPSLYPERGSQRRRMAYPCRSGISRTTMACSRV